MFLYIVYDLYVLSVLDLFIHLLYNLAHVRNDFINPLDNQEFLLMFRY